MSLIATGSSMPVTPVEKYANDSLEFFNSLGTLSGTVMNQANGGLAFICGQAVAPFVLEHLDITHDGMTGAAGHTIEIDVYKVPATVAVQTAIYAGTTYHLATQKVLDYASYTAAGRVNYDLAGENLAGRSFARGDRIVVVFRSVADSSGVANSNHSYYTSSLANVCVAALGRIGKQ
jgi:hypothetical protein